MEWKNWRKVAEEYMTSKPDYRTPQIPVKAFAGSSTMPPVAQVQSNSSPLWRQDLIAKQDSQPAGAIQKAYAHPAWIPLARDWGGNYLATDLAPGPNGTWGQIIIFGRDYDCKYVVARSWGALLAIRECAHRRGQRRAEAAGLQAPEHRAGVPRGPPLAMRPKARSATTE
jgi:cell wall assembly regulator SMI1